MNGRTTDPPWHKVKRTYEEKGKSGFKVFRYKMERLPGQPRITSIDKYFNGYVHVHHKEMARTKEEVEEEEEEEEQEQEKKEGEEKDEDEQGNNEGGGGGGGGGGNGGAVAAAGGEAALGPASGANVNRFRALKKRKRDRVVRLGPGSIPAAGTSSTRTRLFKLADFIHARPYNQIVYNLKSEYIE